GDCGCLELKIKGTILPAASNLVKLNQHYGRLGKTLPEKQNDPDPNHRTYHDSAWTIGLASNINVKPVDDKSVLGEPGELLRADVVTKGSVTGTTGSVFVINHNGSLNLITLPYRTKDVNFNSLNYTF